MKFRIHIQTFAFIILALTSKVSFSQPDSLQIWKSRLQNAKGQERMSLYKKIIITYMDHLPDSAYHYLSQWEKELSKNDEGFLLKMKTLYFLEKKQYRAAEEYAKLLVEKLQDTNAKPEALADAYNTLAGVYYYLENYPEAIEKTFRVLRIYEKSKNIQGMLSAYNNIGLLYKQTENYSKAMEYYQKAIALARENGFQRKIWDLYQNIGVLYKNRKMPDSALVYYRKALQYAQNVPPPQISELYFNMANLYAFYLKKPDSAMHYFNLTIRMLNRAKIPIQARIYGSMGKMFYETGKLDLAEKYIRRALENARKENSKQQKVFAHFYLYKIYKDKGNYAQAVKHLEDFVDIQDSLDKERAQVTIANLEAKYENEKKNIIIQNLEKQRQAARKINILLTVGISLSVFSLFLMYLNYKNRRKKNRMANELLKQKALQLKKDLEYKNKQLTSQALLLLKKNQALGEMKKILEEITCLDKREKNRLKRNLNKQLNVEEDWKLFQLYFQEVNSDFYDKLLKINDKLTPSELKLSALIRLGFNIKETADLLGISPDSVKSSRYVLRRKLGLRNKENLHKFLTDL